MKVGILTHHRVPNFGANLQALSSLRLMEVQGHDVEMLDYTPVGLHERYHALGVTADQARMHEEFVKRFLRSSPPLADEAAIQDYVLAERFDTVISGSDVVFRVHRHMREDEGGFPNPYWLGWCSAGARRVRRASLAGSCGGAEYFRLPFHMRKQMANSLAQFDFVSVRDRWTRWMFMYVTRGRVRAPLCPDPVSVLNQVVEVPEPYEHPARMAGKPYIVLSVENRLLPTEWVTSFRECAHNKGFRVFGLALPDQEMAYAVDKNITLPLSPLEWYSWIKHAAGFIGTKFHPIVCSIFNHVPFVSIDMYHRAGFRGRLKCIRFQSVSKTFDLCKSANALHRLIPADDIARLSPNRALELLMRGSDVLCDQYVVRARQLFRRMAGAALTTRPGMS